MSRASKEALEVLQDREAYALQTRIFQLERSLRRARERLTALEPRRSLRVVCSGCGAPWDGEHCSRRCDEQAREAAQRKPSAGKS